MSRASKHGLCYTDPASTWDEGLPLGNATLGALIWGDGNPLNISIDRADLWDCRSISEYQGPDYSYDVLNRWRLEGRLDDILKLYESPYNRPAPTKLPAGRIKLRWPNPQKFESAALDLCKASASVRIGGWNLDCFIHATDAIGLILVHPSSAETAAGFPTVELVAPAFRGDSRKDVNDGGDLGDLAALGYDEPEMTSGASWSAFHQRGYDGFSFAVYIAWTSQGSDWTAVWSIASTREGSDPLAIARGRVQSALAAGAEPAAKSHRAWWDSYWSKSSIELPNQMLEKQWYLEQYKFGAASRRGAPPINLQGPWTADDGKLPPWKGDFHHDLNTQLSYWPCYSANHLEEGLAFLDWLWKVRPVNRQWTEQFYRLPGLNVPGVTDIDGSVMGGWPQYTFSSTTSAWLAQHFYWHWRYSGDIDFLRTRGYPYVSDVCVFLEALTRERDADGRRSMPLSSSPEIHDNRLDAWFSGITNYDLVLVRWAFDAAAEMAGDLGHPEEAVRWAQVRAELPELAVSDAAGLLVAPGQELLESQRHFSHLMALYPMKLVHYDGGEQMRRVIDTSLGEIERIGTDYWCGYSFAWLANLYAQARRGVDAERSLEIFVSAFTLRNSFHCNGDQSGQGYSKFTYRPFTLEGNFAAANAIQEMLLQSSRGVIRLFPAIPSSWQNVSFTSLRAEGAFLVSALLEQGLCKSLEIAAEYGGICRVISPFTGRELSLDLKAGEVVHLVADPATPAGAAGSRALPTSTEAQ